MFNVFIFIIGKMRHKKERVLQLNTGTKKKSVFIREMITNFVTHGRVTTTSQRAKVLKARTNSFFAKLVSISNRYKDKKDAKREVIRHAKTVLFGDAGRKAVDVLLPKYLEAGTRDSFVETYKMGFRKGDAVQKIMLKLM